MLVHHSSQNYDVAASAAATHARQKMEAKLEEGKDKALQLMEHIGDNVPRDDIVRGNAFNFSVGEYGNIDLAWPKLQSEGAQFGLHQNALQQLAGRMKISLHYLQELKMQAGTTTGKWAQELLVDTLKGFGANHPNFTNKKFLVRTVQGQTRGILSDQYRRLDSRPLLRVFASEAETLGAVPVDTVITDTRAALKVFLPMVFEPVPNEVMCLGAEWFNSDYGAGKYGIRMIIWRLWCTNFMSGEDAISQVHLGSRLSDNIAYSKQTYELDTRTQISATRDVMHSLLSPNKVHGMLDVIRKANDKKVAWKEAAGTLKKFLASKEVEEAETMFEDEEDSMRLPPVKSVYKVSNICSWFAQRQEDPDKKLRLERAAGALLTGKKLEEGA